MLKVVFRYEIYRFDTPFKNINLEAVGKANKNRQKCLTGEEKVAGTLYEKSEVKSNDPVKDMDRQQNSETFEQNSPFTFLLNYLM